MGDDDNVDKYAKRPEGYAVLTPQGPWYDNQRTQPAPRKDLGQGANAEQRAQLKQARQDRNRVDTLFRAEIERQDLIWTGKPQAQRKAVYKQLGLIPDDATEETGEITLVADTELEQGSAAQKFTIKKKFITSPIQFSNGNDRKVEQQMCRVVAEIMKGDETKTEVPVKKVAGPTLALIVQYLKHHKGKNVAEITKPIRSVKIEDIVEDNWDAAFITRDLDALEQMKKAQDTFEAKKITNRETFKDDEAEMKRRIAADKDEMNAQIAAVPIRQDVPAASKAEIFQLILGANYMDIHPLLHLGCAKIATLIKGKSPEEIKKILGDSDAAADAQNTARENGHAPRDSRRRIAELMGLKDLLDN